MMTVIVNNNRSKVVSVGRVRFGLLFFRFLISSLFGTSIVGYFLFVKIASRVVLEDKVAHDVELAATFELDDVAVGRLQLDRRIGVNIECLTNRLVPGALDSAAADGRFEELQMRRDAFEYR